MTTLNKNITFAVAALIRNPSDSNLFLGVSRKDNHSDFGLVGGKLEEGEKPIEGLIREVKEETNLDVSEHKFVYSKMIGSDKIVLYYECSVKDTTKLTSMENAVVKWVTRQDLEQGSFGEYNKSLFRVLETK